MPAWELELIRGCHLAQLIEAFYLFRFPEVLAASGRTLSTPHVPPSNLSLKIVTNARDVAPYHYVAYPDLTIQEASDPVAEAWKNDAPAAVVPFSHGDSAIVASPHFLRRAGANAVVSQLPLFAADSSLHESFDDFDPQWVVSDELIRLHQSYVMWCYS